MKNKIKKLFTSLLGMFGMLIAVGPLSNSPVSAAGTSYSATFKSGSSDSSTSFTVESDLTSVFTSNDLFTGITEVSKVYVGKNGAKFGSSNALGTITLSLADAVKSDITSIVVETAQYNTDSGSFVLSLDGAEVASAVAGSAISYVPDSPASANSLTLSTTSKRGYVSSVTFSIGGEVAKYNVSFDGNGGTGTMNTISAVEGNYKVPECTIEAPSGQIFDCWNTKSDGTGDTYQPNDELNLSSDITLFAIWKEKPAPSGNTKLTHVSALTDLANGDGIVFAGTNNDETRLSTAFSGTDKFIAALYSAEINDDAIYTDSENFIAFTLEKNESKDDSYALKTGSNYVGINGNDLKPVTSALYWDFSVADGDIVIADPSNENNKIQFNYNNGNSRFKTYTSSQKKISLYKVGAGVSGVSISQKEASGYVGGTLTLVASPVNLTPNSYSWSTEDTDLISITSGSTSNSVTLECLAEGTATIKVVVNGDESLSATCTIIISSASANVITPGQYLIANKDKSHMFGGDLADHEFDPGDSTALFDFVFAGKGDDTYYIMQGDKYLVPNKELGASNSSMSLSGTTTSYWTISKDADNYFHIENSYNNSQMVCNPDTNKLWYTYTNQSTEDDITKLNLVSSLPFNKVVYTTTEGAKTEFNVGETFDPTGYTFLAQYGEGTSAYTVPLANQIYWNPITEANIATGTVTGVVKIGNDFKTVEVTGLTITNYAPSSIALTGTYKTSYLIGEDVDITGLKVNETLSNGEGTKVLNDIDSSMFDYTPKFVGSDTTEITVFLVGHREINTTYSISKTQKTYYVTNYVSDGDNIVLGARTKSANYELDIDGTSAGASIFTYDPQGLEELEVVATSYAITDADGVSRKAFALKNSEGKYLRKDGKTLTYKAAGEGGAITCGYSNNEYDFNWYVDVDGFAGSVNLSGSYNSSNSTYELSGYFQNTNDANPTLFGTVYCDLYNNGTGDIYLESYKAPEYSQQFDTLASVSWENNGGTILIYRESQGSTTIAEDAAWLFLYDKINERMEVYNYSDTVNDLSFNPDGDGNFKIYDGQHYEDITIYRRNDAYESGKGPVSVSVDESYVKTEYKVGDIFEYSGLIVEARYGNGSIISTVPFGGYDISAPDMTTAGTKTITVTVGKGEQAKSDTFIINVSAADAPAQPTIVSAYVTGQTTVFNEGDQFIFDGTVTAVMSDQSLQVLTSDQYNIVTPSMQKGQRNVVIRIPTGNGQPIEVKYLITVNEVITPVVLDSIEVSSASKTQYYIGDTFENPIVIAHRTGTGATDSEVTNYQIDASINLLNGVVGEETLNISYTEDGVTKTTSYTITVSERPYILDAYVSLSKENFTIGENFSIQGMKVYAKYSDSEEYKPVTGYSVDSSAYDKDTLGSYEIVVTIPGYSKPVTFTVNVVPHEYNNVELYYKTSNNAQVGGTQQLYFRQPVNNRDEEVPHIWDNFTCTSSNEDVATVNENGLVTYTGVGSCVITVAAKNGSGVDTFEVFVAGETKTIEVTNKPETLYANETYKLNAFAKDENGSDITRNEPLTFESSDETVLTVNENGVISPLHSGSAVVTVRSLDGTVENSFTVNVLERPSTISIKNEITTMEVGETATLDVEVNPVGSNQDVTFSSNNENVATVSSSGVITALSEGTVTIKVTSNEDSNIYAILRIAVTGKMVKGISLDQTSLSFDKLGDSVTLTASVNPSDAKNTLIIWSSSDTSVATVVNGVVKAVSEGTATITVTTLDGGFKATCEVTVKLPEPPEHKLFFEELGCGGSVLASSFAVSMSLITAVGFLLCKKRKDN